MSSSKMSSMPVLAVFTHDNLSLAESNIYGSTNL
jgi:hypothetical protein